MLLNFKWASYCLLKSAFAGQRRVIKLLKYGSVCSFFFTCISIITAHVLLYTFSSSLYLYFTKERFIKMIYAVENYDLIAVFIGITNETCFYKLQVNHLSSELPLIGWIKWKAHVWCSFESHWRNTFNLCIQKSFSYFKWLTNNLLFHSCAEVIRFWLHYYYYYFKL